MRAFRSEAGSLSAKSYLLSAHPADGAHTIFGMPLSPCTTGTSPPLFHDFRNFALQMRGCNLALKCAHAQ